MNFNYDIVTSGYDAFSGTSWVEIHSDEFNKNYRGTAKCHPDEKYPSEFPGCRIAETRAAAKYMKDAKRMYKYQLAALQNYYNIIKDMKGFNPKSKEASKARRCIKEYQGMIKGCDDMIKQSLASIEPYLKERNEFLDKIAERNAKASKNDNT